MASNEDLLKQIREDFDRDLEMFREIRQEADIDMRFLAGEQWDSKEKQERHELGRPCLIADQLNQYANQVVNEFLINKRDVQVDPVGSGVNDPEARIRSDIQRQIHYDSNGDDAHISAVENAIQRSYGVWGLLTEYVSEGESDDPLEAFQQKVVIRRFPNPNAVLWNLSDCKEADYSDMTNAFVIEQIRTSQFKKRFPHAEIKDFSPEHMHLAPHWIKGDNIQLAEYWYVDEVRRELIVITDPATGQPVKLFMDELPEGAKLDRDILVTPGGLFPLLKDDSGNPLRRRVKERQVTQYLTNGVELLDETPWVGSYIPLFPVIGKELIVDTGAGPKRIWLSLIRLARDPQQVLNHYITTETEVVGMSPKTKYIVYEGQLAGHEAEWEHAHRSPQIALQVKPMLDATGQAVLPLPRREDYEPPIQGLEMGAQSAKRLIQNAMGMYNVSVGQSDTSVRSGVAIERLDLQSDVGTFHFRASLDRALKHEGRCIDELLSELYSSVPRSVGTRTKRGKYKSVRINQPWLDPDTGKEVDLQISKRHRSSVTISVGPSYQTERARAEEFVNFVVKQAPGLFERIGDLLIHLKNLGDIGDEIAERVTPPEFRTPDGKAQVPPEFQQKFQQAMELNDMLTEQLKRLTEERDRKVLEIESRERIEQLRIDLEKYKADLQAVTRSDQMASNENIALMEQRIAARIERDRAQLEQRIAELSAPRGEAEPAEV